MLGDLVAHQTEEEESNKVGPRAEGRKISTRERGDEIFTQSTL